MKLQVPLALSTRLWTTTTPAFILAFIASLLLIATGHAGSRARLALPSPPSLAAGAQSASQRERLETELITIQPSGFEPAEITRPPGRFVLGVDNRSGLDDIELRLERAGDGRVAALQARKRKSSWREEVSFPPGQYLLKEANHPEWTCLITITSR